MPCVLTFIILQMWSIGRCGLSAFIKAHKCVSRYRAVEVLEMLAAAQFILKITGRTRNVFGAIQYGSKLGLPR